MLSLSLLQCFLTSRFLSEVAMEVGMTGSPSRFLGWVRAFPLLFFESQEGRNMRPS